MEKITKVFRDFFDKIRETEAYNQLKAKYDELDTQSKLYFNLGVLGAVALCISLTVFIGIAKLNGLKNDINEREELIGLLQRSADTIKQLKTQAPVSRAGGDLSTPVSQFLDSIVVIAGLDRSKVDIGQERQGSEDNKDSDKNSKETLIDLKLTQVNLKQLMRLLFSITDQGSARGLDVKELNVDTKGDPSGYIDASMTVASYKAK